MFNINLVCVLHNLHSVKALNRNNSWLVISQHQFKSRLMRKSLTFTEYLIVKCILAT